MVDEHDDKEKEESVETGHSFRGRDIYLVFKSQRMENTSTESEREKEGERERERRKRRKTYLYKTKYVLSREIVFGNKNPK